MGHRQDRQRAKRVGLWYLRQYLKREMSAKPNVARKKKIIICISYFVKRAMFDTVSLGRGIISHLTFSNSQTFSVSGFLIQDWSYWRAAACLHNLMVSLWCSVWIRSKREPVFGVIYCACQSSCLLGSALWPLPSSWYHWLLNGPSLNWLGCSSYPPIQIMKRPLKQDGM